MRSDHNCLSLLTVLVTPRIYSSFLSEALFGSSFFSFLRLCRFFLHLSYTLFKSKVCTTLICKYQCSQLFSAPWLALLSTPGRMAVQKRGFKCWPTCFNICCFIFGRLTPRQSTSRQRPIVASPTSNTKHLP